MGKDIRFSVTCLFPSFPSIAVTLQGTGILDLLILSLLLRALEEQHIGKRDLCWLYVKKGTSSSKANAEEFCRRKGCREWRDAHAHVKPTKVLHICTSSIIKSQSKSDFCLLLTRPSWKRGSSTLSANITFCHNPVHASTAEQS